MKIALLKCDKVAPELIHLDGDYDDMFIRLFSEFAPEIEFTVYDIVNNEYPLSLDSVKGYLSTGSRFSVYDEEPWILRYRDFIKTLYENNKKLIGICFGHQMIAHALGGLTAKSDKGWGVGVKRVAVARDMPWMKPPLKEYKLIFTHQDQVEKLPPGAMLLGGYSHCVNAMFQVGDQFLGIQAHPEFSERYVKALMLPRVDQIGRGTMNAAIETLHQNTSRIEMTQWMFNFFRE